LRRKGRKTRKEAGALGHDNNSLKNEGQVERKGRGGIKKWSGVSLNRSAEGKPGRGMMWMGCVGMKRGF
jgi:hypothetical protein